MVVMGWQLDLRIVVVFSNLNDSRGEGVMAPQTPNCLVTGVMADLAPQHDAEWLQDDVAAIYIDI